jgi:uncharacterized LabA/DUF88 family protein
LEISLSRLIVYVDGFNLYHGLKDKFQHKMLWLDLVALTAALRPRSEIVQVKYFTAPVLGQPDALSRQTIYQHALAAANPGKVTIIQGRYQRKTVKCRRCGRTTDAMEEKETDVNIAVALVADAAERAMDTAILVSADSDLTPAVRTVARLRPEIVVLAAFPPKRFSAELKSLMPSSFPIGTTRIAQSLLPESVLDLMSGQTYTRPGKWR